MEGQSGRHWGILLAAVVSLAACGGGGGGKGGNTDASATGTGKSFEEIEATYAKLRIEAWKGATQAAALTDTNIIAFARAVVSDEFPQESTTAAKAKPHEFSHSAATAFSQLKRTSLETSSVARAKGTTRESFDENMDCPAGGSLHHTGSINDAGVGTVDVNYTDCNMGGLVFNGQAVLYVGDDTRGEVHFYNHVKMTSDGVTRTITGSINNTEIFDNNYGMGQIGTITNAVIEDSGTGFSIQMENYQEFDIESSSGSAETNEYRQRYSDKYANGKIYLSQTGYMEVNGRIGIEWVQLISSGNLKLNSADGKEARLTFDESNVRVELHDEKKPSEAAGTYVSFADLAYYTPLPDLNFVPLAQLNTPPKYSGFAFVTQTATTLTPIEVILDGYSDPENDTVTVTYEWHINSKKMADQTSNVFPAGLAKRNDVVQVFAVLNDGHNTVHSKSLSILIGDAPVSILTSELPDSITLGSDIEFSAVYADPDDQGSEVSGQIVLAYGPQGVSIENNTVRWTPQSLLFGKEQTFHIGLNLSNGSTAPKDVVIKVIDPNGTLPTARSAVTIEPSDNALWVGQLDDDAQMEILSSDGDSRIFTLQKSGDTYQQEWLYPFRLDTKNELVQVTGHDNDNDGKAEIYAASQKNIFRLTLRTQVPEKIFSFSDRYSDSYSDSYKAIKAFVIGDMDNDGDNELVVLIQDYDGGYSASIEIVDIASGQTERSITLNALPERMAIGNVDTDAAMEIVLDNGLVYDGASGSNQWLYSSEFGDHIAVGDINADGVDEIIGADRWDSGATIFNADTKKRITTININSVCALNVRNIDSDLQEEILIDACGQNEMIAYDGITTTPAPQWRHAMGYSSVNTLTTGDADNDGQPEILWSSQDSMLFIADPVTDGAVWNNDAIPKPDSHIGLGWAEITPDNEGAMFLIPSSTHDGGGTRIATLTDAGEIEFSPRLDVEYSGAQSGAIADYDANGFDDVLIAYERYPQSILQLFQLNDFSQKWSRTASVNYASARDISLTDLTNDDIADAIYIIGQNIEAINIWSSTMIWSSGKLDANIEDVDTYDLDNDGIKEIIVSTTNELSVWKKDNAGYTKVSTVQQRCKRLVVGNLDLDSTAEIACANQAFYYEEKKLNIFESSLALQASIPFDNEISDLSLMDQQANGTTGILVSTSVRPDIYSWDFEGTQISLYTAASNTPVWSSPLLLGIMPARSMHTFTDSTGKQRLTFATDKAMYLTH